MNIYSSEPVVNGTKPIIKELLRKKKLKVVEPTIELIDDNYNSSIRKDSMIKPC